MNLKELTELYSDLLDYQHHGVSGVRLFESGNPGPTVGITVMTHGNEPVGLYAYKYFKENPGKILCGQVYFILNNPHAGANYLKAFAENDTDAKRYSRNCDVNMNRLPVNVMENFDDMRYECLRARELAQVWSKFDFGLDIHSTSQPSDAMIIALERSDLELIQKLPFVTVVSNIEEIQRDKPASYFYGHSNSSIFGLEAGSHENEESIENAVNSVKIFLQILGMHAVETSPANVGKEVYRVFQAIWFPNMSYELVKTYQMFEFIPKGGIIATGDQGDIYAPQDCFALFPPAKIKPVFYDEEVLFLTHRV